MGHFLSSQALHPIPSTLSDQTQPDYLDMELSPGWKTKWLSAEMAEPFLRLRVCHVMWRPQTDHPVWHISYFSRYMWSPYRMQVLQAKGPENCWFLKELPLGSGSFTSRLFTGPEDSHSRGDRGSMFWLCRPVKCGWDSRREHLDQPAFPLLRARALGGHGSGLQLQLVTPRVLPKEETAGSSRVGLGVGRVVCVCMCACFAFNMLE